MPENDRSDGESWADYENGEDELGANEFLEALEENALIDAIGDGGDVPENVDSERGMAAFLTKFRDWGQQDPITTPPWEKHAEKPLPPRQTTTGGQLSINEGAQQLHQIGGNQQAQGVVQGLKNVLEQTVAQGIQQAVQTLQEHGAAAMNAAGGDEGRQLGGRAESAKNMLEDLGRQVANAIEQSTAAVQAIEAFYSHVRDSASKHSG